MIYDDLIGRAGLTDIHDKVLAGQRLSLDDGLRLYACDDLPVLGYLANIVRERKSGDTAYYVRNQHINYTNICNKLCRFCSFYVKPKDERGYVLSPEQVAARVAEYDQAPITEIHMVGGVNPKLPYQYYLDVLQAMKQARPAAHLKAFTMIEIAQIQRIAKKPLEEIFADMKAAGLESLPGGGAEVFSDRVQGDLFWTKADSEEWLEIAQTAHRAGLPSNATMLYGHIENTAGEGLSSRAAARSAGRDWRFSLLYPTLFSPRAHRVRGLAWADGLPRSQGNRRGAADARQLPPRQDLLDYEYH